MSLWPWFIFVTACGACVGSFLNVVILRVPMGMSVVHPPSHDFETGKRLAWWENIPIVSYLLLRGKSRHSGQPISLQYPMVEAVTATLFAGLFIVYYWSGLRTGFAAQGFANSWPVFVVHLVLLASLIAATVIDWRYYIIPLQIPWVATAVAIVVMPSAAAFGYVAPASTTAFGQTIPAIAPVASAAGIGGAIGGVLGLIIALGLLQTGMLPRSFNDVEAEISDDSPQDEIMAYPHSRREVLKELMFVLFPLIGVLSGVLLTGGNQPVFGPTVSPPFWLQVLGGSVGGYLVGGGIIWITRIVFTLAFGKEAMGLGDVHLLGAIGAVIGGIDSVLVFFIAPVCGLAIIAVRAGIPALAKGEVRVIPYGPFLAMAAVIVMVIREPLLAWLMP